MLRIVGTDWFKVDLNANSDKQLSMHIPAIGKRLVTDFNCQTTENGKKITFTEKIPFLNHLEAQSSIVCAKKVNWTKTKTHKQPMFFGNSVEENCIVLANGKVEYKFCYKQTCEKK